MHSVYSVHVYTHIKDLYWVWDQATRLPGNPNIGQPQKISNLTLQGLFLITTILFIVPNIPQPFQFLNQRLLNYLTMFFYSVFCHSFKHVYKCLENLYRWKNNGQITVKIFLLYCKLTTVLILMYSYQL